MVYQLKTSSIYGPVNSRRLGKSLGVNLLPWDRKICTFDCVYCHYGDTDRVVGAAAGEEAGFPSLSMVQEELETVLRRFRDRNDALDHITFSGNGEPTLHPDFGLFVDEAKSLRDRYAPGVPVAILSNSTTVHRPHVRKALMKLDRRIMKLDAGDQETFQAVNRPHASVTLKAVIGGLSQLEQITLQTAFMTGSVDNVQPKRVEAWVDAVGSIRPEGVQLYTIDRPSADGMLKRVERSVLERIARQVEDRTGVPASVY